MKVLTLRDQSRCRALNGRKYWMDSPSLQDTIIHVCTVSQAQGFRRAHATGWLGWHVHQGISPDNDTTLIQRWARRHGKHTGGSEAHPDGEGAAGRNNEPTSSHVPLHPRDPTVQSWKVDITRAPRNRSSWSFSYLTKVTWNQT